MDELMKPETLTALTELAKALTARLAQVLAIITFAASVIGGAYAMLRNRKP